MNELYRIVPYDPDALDPTVIVGRREMLVKVEPCEHGMVMPHDWIDYKEARRSDGVPIIIDCPGALKRNNEEE